MATDLERAVKLREAGLSYPEIARYLRRGVGTIHRWCNPETQDRGRETSRAWKAANRERVRDYAEAHKHRPCPNCGGPMKRHGANQCRECRAATEITCYSLIEGMWADGWALREIAAALGRTENSVHVTFHRMRRDGWDLPYRYAMENGRRLAA